jgi:bacterioferritin (cytochrome b1)
MANIKDEMINLLNHALELEHAARIQYLAHAELIKGQNAEPIIGRIKEIADDEKKHEDKFRNLIGSYLGGEPVMSLAATHRARTLEEILNTDLRQEKEGIEFYKKIYKTLMDNKNEFAYQWETLEHDLRHIILDEEEHIVELSILLGL